LAKIDKLYNKFYKKPIPNDITFDEMATLMKFYGCEIEYGGNHPKVVHRETGTIIPVPRHGKTIGEAYVKQLKDLLDMIKEE